MMTRKTALNRVTSAGRKLAEHGKKGVALTWGLAEAMLDLRGTYAAGDDKAFYAAAATHGGVDETSVRTYVNAAETRASLTQAHAAATKTWPVDSVVVLRNVKNADRTKIIAKAQKANGGKGTTNTKAIREFKKQVVGTSPRNRKNAEDRKLALAQKIAERVQKAIDSGHDLTAMIVGAQMAQDNPGEDVAAALIFLRAQVTKPTPVVKA